MMIRSMPPASAHLADRPVPAPPPMMGRPAATWARRRSRHSSWVKALIARPPSVVFVPAGLLPWPLLLVVLCAGPLPRALVGVAGVLVGVAPPLARHLILFVLDLD